MESEPEDLLAFYSRYLKRCNEHRFDELGEFIAEDVNGPTEGLSGYIAGLRAVVEAFPYYQWKLQPLLVDDQWLAARLYGAGTHTGPFRGIAATGRVIRTQELVIYRTADGKIVECWGDLGSTVRDELYRPARPERAATLSTSQAKIYADMLEETATIRDLAA
jgi:predicted ester cyclase